jgi:hypothetical protein
MLRLMLVCMAGGWDWYVVVRGRTETMQRMNKRDTRRKGNRIREAKPVASAYRNGERNAGSRSTRRGKSGDRRHGRAARMVRNNKKNPEQKQRETTAEAATGQKRTLWESKNTDDVRKVGRYGLEWVLERVGGRGAYRNGHDPTQSV